MPEHQTVSSSHKCRDLSVLQNSRIPLLSHCLLDPIIPHALSPTCGNIHFSRINIQLPHLRVWHDFIVAPSPVTSYWLSFLLDWVISGESTTLFISSSTNTKVRALASRCNTSILTLNMAMWAPLPCADYMFPLDTPNSDCQPNVRTLHISLSGWADF